jgi:hypothetical protein
VRRRAFAALLGALPFSAGAQQRETASAFVNAIYQPYRQKGFKGQPYTDAERYFEPVLAAAMRRDGAAAQQRNEVPLLNGDPFIDAQEWEITSLSIALTTHGERASAGVALVNLGKPYAVALTLVQTSAGWRIVDVLGPSGSLRSLYKLR